MEKQEDFCFITFIYVYLSQKNKITWNTEFQAWRLKIGREMRAEQ